MGLGFEGDEVQIEMSLLDHGQSRNIEIGNRQIFIKHRWKHPDSRMCLLKFPKVAKP